MMSHKIQPMGRLETANHPYSQLRDTGGPPSVGVGPSKMFGTKIFCFDKTCETIIIIITDKQSFHICSTFEQIDCLNVWFISVVQFKEELIEARGCCIQSWRKCYSSLTMSDLTWLQ